MTPHEDKKLIEILRARDSLHTRLEMHDGRTLDVWNIAWGYDMGDDVAHVTANISPERPGFPAHFFCTNEVARVIDAESGKELARFGQTT